MTLDRLALGRTTRLLFTAVIALFYVLGTAAMSAQAGKSRDSDRDGMPKRWEHHHGLDMRGANAVGDPHHHGLKDLR